MKHTMLFHISLFCGSVKGGNYRVPTETEKPGKIENGHRKFMEHDKLVKKNKKSWDFINFASEYYRICVFLLT